MNNFFVQIIFEKIEDLIDSKIDCNESLLFCLRRAADFKPRELNLASDYADKRKEIFLGSGNY